MALVGKVPSQKADRVALSGLQILEHAMSNDRERRKPVAQEWPTKERIESLRKLATTELLRYPHQVVNACLLIELCSMALAYLDAQARAEKFDGTLKSAERVWPANDRPEYTGSCANLHKTIRIGNARSQPR